MLIKVGVSVYTSNLCVNFLVLASQLVRSPRKRKPEKAMQRNGVSKVFTSLQYAGLVCAMLGCAVYLNTLRCGYCFDDRSAIVENKDLQPSSSWANLLWNDFWGTPMHIEGSHKSYRPLCVATFRLNYLLYELQPMGYHLVNILLHGVVCYLYVQLCSLVLSEVWPALIAGLLFAVHPIHTEAVAGLVGRAESLSSLFFLLTFLCYRRAARPDIMTTKELKWLALSLVCCVCSVLSKEQGITAVAVCYTYDVFIARNLNISTGLTELSLLKKRVPLWFKPLVLRGVVLALFVVGFMMVRLQIMKAELPVFTVHDNPAVALETPYRQLHWAYLVFVNVWLLINPYFLCADWTMGTIPLITSLADPRNLLTIATFVVLFVLGWTASNRNGRTAKVTLFSLSLMVFPYLPASNLFFPVGFVVAERVLYLPSMGLCLLVALGCTFLLKKSPMVSKALLIFLLVTHSVRTYTRNMEWESDKELFTSAVHANPGNGKVYNNLGHEYEHSGQLEIAEKLFRSASQIQPDDVGAFINLGRVLKLRERYSEAEKAYRKAVELMPKGKSFRVAPSHINVYYNLANLIRTDPSRMVEAYDLYQTALSMKPDFVEAHMNKGDLLLKLNKTEDARQSFEKAIHFNPDYTDAHYNLGTAFMLLGDKKGAERCYRRALSLDGQHVHALLSLASVLRELNKPDEEKEILHQLLDIDSQNTRAYFNLGVNYLDRQDEEKSEEMFLRALSLDPSYRSALFNLGVLYNYNGRYGEAEDVLLRLVTFHPDHLNGLQLLGDVYTKLQRIDDAQEMYEAVLKQNSNHVTSLHNLGVVKAGLGEMEMAIQLFSRALHLDNSHEAARKHLMQAQQILNNSKVNSNNKTNNSRNK